MKVLDRNYVENKIFSELKMYIDFYRSLSTAVFGFSTLGTTSI